MKPSPYVDATNYINTTHYLRYDNELYDAFRFRLWRLAWLHCALRLDIPRDVRLHIAKLIFPPPEPSCPQQFTLTEQLKLIELLPNS